MLTTHIKAVAYVRRSSKSETQSASIPQQRKAIQKLAEDKGYEIIEWYEDDAISGSERETRHGLLTMLQDAEVNQNFEAILLWKQSRFSREEPMDSIESANRIRRLGMYLVTCDKGMIDWKDFTTQLLYFVESHKNHQYVKDLSDEVCKGQQTSRDNNSPISGPPYGYTIEGERHNKTFVLGDPKHVEIVRRIFKEFVHDRRSPGEIARRLQQEGYPSPKASRENARGKWERQTVEYILKNQRYCGDFISGEESYGKFNRLAKDEIISLDGYGDKKQRTKNPKTDWAITLDTHEHIIDRDTFEKAQELLANRSRGKTRTKPEQEESPYLFSGILRCGKCGCPLWGKYGHINPVYLCSNSKAYNNDECKGTRVQQSTLLAELGLFLTGVQWDKDDQDYYYDPDDDFLCDVIIGTVDDANLPHWFVQLREALTPPKQPKGQRTQLEKQRTKLNKDIERAEGNLALVEPENIPPIQQKLRELRQQRETLERELNALKPIPEQTLREVTFEIAIQLKRLGMICGLWSLPPEGYNKLSDLMGLYLQTIGTSEDDQRLTLQKILSRIQIICDTQSTGEGKGIRHRLAGGEIRVDGVAVIDSKLNPSVLLERQSTSPDV